MEKWEYVVVDILTKEPANTTTDRLNQLGLQGWEMVGVYQANWQAGMPMSVRIILKRRKP